MEKITVSSTSKPLVMFFLLGGLGTIGMLMSGDLLGKVASGFMYLLALVSILSLRKIEISEKSISVKWYLLPRRRTYSYENITHVVAGFLPSTTASRTGLMKRGEIIRIISDQGPPINITSSTDDQYEQILAFFEDHYGDKMEFKYQ